MTGPASIAPAGSPRVGIVSVASFTYAAIDLLHAAIDAALQLRSKDKVAVAQISRIDIDMPQADYGHGGWQAIHLLHPIGAQMNVAC